VHFVKGLAYNIKYDPNISDGYPMIRLEWKVIKAWCFHFIYTCAYVNFL